MDLRKLRQEQEKLAKKIILKDDFEDIKLIAGVDEAYSGNKIICAVVVFKFPSFEFVEQKYIIAQEPMKYIPGFLSYRLAPIIIKTFHKLEHRPDLLMVNGHGISHPKRIGLASHVGLALDVPTIGVASKLLIGDEIEDVIMVEGEKLGHALVAKEYAKPIYISQGHKINFTSSLKITKQCMKGNKLPLPLHEAHKLANKVKKKLVS